MIILKQNDLKNYSIESLIAILQGNENGLTKKYRSFRENFEKGYNSDKLDLKALRSFLCDFEGYLENFIILQDLFIIKIQEEKNLDKKALIQAYIEFTNIYINSIQGIYLNKISQKINLLEFDISLKKSNKSIRLAWIGIFIGAIISWTASKYYYEKNLKDQNKDRPQLEQRIILDSVKIKRLEDEKKY